VGGDLRLARHLEEDVDVRLGGSPMQNADLATLGQESRAGSPLDCLVVAERTTGAFDCACAEVTVKAAMKTSVAKVQAMGCMAGPLSGVNGPPRLLARARQRVLEGGAAVYVICV